MKSIYNLLGLARRARNLCWGMDATISHIYHQTVYLVILAADLSDGSKTKIKRAAEKMNILVFEAFDCETLGQLVQKDRCGIIGILDESFARGICQKWL